MHIFKMRKTINEEKNVKELLRSMNAELSHVND